MPRSRAEEERGSTKPHFYHKHSTFKAHHAQSLHLLRKGSATLNTELLSMPWAFAEDFHPRIVGSFTHAGDPLYSVQLVIALSGAFGAHFMLILMFLLVHYTTSPPNPTQPQPRSQADRQSSIPSETPFPSSFPLPLPLSAYTIPPRRSAQSLRSTTHLPLSSQLRPTKTNTNTTR